MYTIINGCQVYYEVHGKEDGEAIFFVHGGPGMSDCRGDIAAFASLGNEYKLVFMDMRGSGRSEGKPPFTHEQWTEDIDELRKQLGLSKIKMLGGSYGGFLTLEYAIRYPKNLTHIILRDTAPSNRYNDLSTEKALTSQLPGINEEMLYRLFNGQVQSNGEFKKIFESIQPLYTVEWDAEKAKNKLDSIYFHYETHNFAFSINKQSYDVTEQLRNIKIPVLVTVGRHDWITPVVASEDIANEINNSILIIFENSGHLPHREENDEYVKLVRKFIKNEVRIENDAFGTNS
ncbi:alpha/beta fold hydrolase [Bacillus mycoides]|uniref:alpha/beta fold hydrolase n=1 Tax=Bacillus mycoides TaxID=1405 RepID=UPI002110FE99|nr:alpha/beta hydrolase [Bacillus mycoides]MCQ6530424.1 alpha/beta hydrolase [Bacillus mycoides]